MYEKSNQAVATIYQGNYIFHYARGYVEAGRREGLCQVTCLENGIRMLRASYYNDRSGEI